MLKNLQKKWKVKPMQLFWILCVFAITGTSTAYITKAITGWAGLTAESFWAWKVLLRVGMLVFGYPAILLIVAFFFGQLAFFKSFLKKMLQSLKILKKDTGADMTSSNKKKLAVFASGAGSNADQIIKYFKDSDNIEVAVVVCNKPGAGVISVAEKNNIPVLMIEKENFFRGDGYLNDLKKYSINFIVLAGFLWKIPQSLINAYPKKIINIHPALLPKYGGKGMYGANVHHAVINAKELYSGITIHYVDEHYDNGDIIFQEQCPIEPNDTAETIAEKIHALEHRHYTKVIEQVVTNI